MLDAVTHFIFVLFLGSLSGLMNWFLSCGFLGDDKLVHFLGGWLVFFQIWLLFVNWVLFCGFLGDG